MINQEKESNSLQSKYELKLNELQCKLKHVEDKLNEVNHDKVSHFEKIKNNTTLLNTVLHDVSQLKKVICKLIASLMENGKQNWTI